MNLEVKADAGDAFLSRLLQLSESAPDRSRPASAAPNYDELTTAEMICRFRARMQVAERAGAIAIRQGKRERRHLIERIVVKDAVVLARHLGREPAAILASESKKKLEPIVHGLEPWLSELLDRISGRWSRNEAAYRLLPNDTNAAAEFLSLLAAISKNQARGLDARTFSLRVTGDSKAFDRHSSRIVAAYAEKCGEVGIGANEVWTGIGLERFSHPICLKGPLTIRQSGKVLVDGRASPFACIHPDMLPLLELTTQPTLLLTVENYASFNRYVREIDDGSLVVYTAGFPSHGVVELLNRLLRILASSVQFFHWGDIDPGGLRIFRHLEESLPRQPLPHLMDRALAEKHGRPGVEDTTLWQIAQSESAVAEVAGWLSGRDNIRHLEQEALDPISPLAGHMRAATRVADYL